MTPLRFTFVIARYGTEILGGAERHARAVAERLAARSHDVRVLTTCATSYRTWRNEYQAGVTTEGGVTIERFAVERGRRASEVFLKQLTHSFPSSSVLSRAWVRAQGPDVPALLQRLSEERAQRDLFVFFQLLSCTTVTGLPRVAERSVLIPLVHRERGVTGRIAVETLARPAALFANTDEEARTIREVAAACAPIRVVAVGLDAPMPAGSSAKPVQPYLLFMGRTGKMKPLLRTWTALTTSSSLPPLSVNGRSVPWADVQLVITGEESSDAAGLPNVVQRGFVDDHTRWDLLRGAEALINPSLYESLSLILLEAWTVERPVVVNARCDVTTGLTARAQGGIAVDFAAPQAAARAIAEGLASEERRAEYGSAGCQFATSTFVWDRVLDAYEDAARAAAARRP
ncbi:MAG: glycosyltransferase family 4 protein [Vicinamibacterales bacterium]